MLRRFMAIDDLFMSTNLDSVGVGCLFARV